MRVVAYLLLVIGCVSTALFTGCGKQAERISTDTLATVDGRAITEETFRYWWERKGMSKDDAAVRERLLDELIEREATVARAEAAGLADDPELREQVRSLLIARMREQELQPKLATVQISEQELQEQYQANKDTRFAVPERVQVAVLWFETRGQAPLVARYRPKLEKVREVLTADPGAAPAAQGFGQMAIANTEHRASRYKGGVFGWMEVAGPHHSDPIHRVAAELAGGLKETGDLSAVTVRDEGLFLVRLMAREPARIKSLDEVRGAIEQRLLADKRHDAETDFRTRMTNGLEVERRIDQLIALTNLPVRKGDAPDSLFPNNVNQKTITRSAP